MRILHIIGNMGSGGAEKLILETLPLYEKNKIKCDLLVFNGFDFPFMKAIKQTNCCNVYSLGNGSIYNPILIFKIIPYLKKYDVAHVHLFPAQYWVVFSKLISFSKIKLVLTEHNSTNSRMTNFLLKHFDKLVYRFYSKVICITKEIQEKFIYYTKLNPNQFALIHNGVNLEHIHNSLSYNKAEISNLLEPNDKLIIQVSRFNKQKDQKTLIQALQYLPEEIKLLLVGEGDLKEECEKLTSQLGLSKRVLFLGLRMDVPRLLKSADIIVLSTFFEGLSLSSIEGMASGKPFIGSNVDGLSNVISDAGILFERGNSKQLARIIMDLVDDKKYYEKVVRECLKRSNNYDINLMFEKHIELYKSIL